MTNCARYLVPAKKDALFQFALMHGVVLGDRHQGGFGMPTSLGHCPNAVALAHTAKKS